MPLKKTTKKKASTRTKKKAVKKTARSVSVSTRTRSVQVRQTVVDDFVIIPKTNDDISLTVIIGDIDQTGSSRIEVAGVFPPEHRDGSFYNLSIGKCKQLDGQTLLLITSVTDTNNNTNNNRTEVTIKLQVAENVLYVRRMQSDVASEGDTETYIFNIKLYAF